MSWDKPTPFSISIIYWLTNIIFTVIVITGFAVVILNVLFYINSESYDLQLHFLLPSKIDYLEPGFININNQNVKIELVEATSKIHFFNTPSFIAKQFGFILIVIVLWLIFLTNTFRLFIKNVYEGEIFTFANISLLKRLSYGLFAFWGLSIIYFQISYHYLAKNLVLQNIRISDDLPNYSGVLLLGIFIWVLAHILKKGLEQNNTPI